MSLNDRDWYRRELARKNGRLKGLDEMPPRSSDFVQLPLPGVIRRPNWLVRAFRSEWFNVGLALAAVLVALAFLGGCSSMPPCEERTTVQGIVIPADVACMIDRQGSQ